LRALYLTSSGAPSLTTVSAPNLEASARQQSERSDRSTGNKPEPRATREQIRPEEAAGAAVAVASSSKGSKKEDSRKARRKAEKEARRGSIPYQVIAAHLDQVCAHQRPPAPTSDSVHGPSFAAPAQPRAVGRTGTAPTLPRCVLSRSAVPDGCGRLFRAA
jgi:hypothetical protein